MEKIIRDQRKVFFHEWKVADSHLHDLVSQNMILLNVSFFLSAEHLRDWRQRYFILKDNGEFIGYRKEPSTEAELSNILNNFTVKNCEIILTERPKKFTFIIRGLHLTTVVERTFHTDSEEER